MKTSKNERGREGNLVYNLFFNYTCIDIDITVSKSIYIQTSKQTAEYHGGSCEIKKKAKNASEIIEISDIGWYSHKTVIQNVDRYSQFSGREGGSDCEFH